MGVSHGQGDLGLRGSSGCLPASAPAFISSLPSLPASLPGAEFFLRGVILRPAAARPRSPFLPNEPRTAGQTFRLLLLQYSHLHT